MKSDQLDIQQRFEEKLMEAKVFLSEARYTNIDVDVIKELVKESVNLRKEGKYEEGIKKSEEAISISQEIIKIFDLLKEGKKKIKELKKNDIDFQHYLENLKEAKDKADEGEYKVSKDILSDSIEQIDEELESVEKQVSLSDDEKLVLDIIPKEGTTVHTLNKELEEFGEDYIKELIDTLNDKEMISVEEKGRWTSVNLVEPIEEKRVTEIKEEAVEKVEEIDVMVPDIPNIIIEVDEGEEEFLDHLWDEIMKDVMDEKTMKALKWDKKQAFLNDIFNYGLMKIKENPMEFIKERILNEFPIVKDKLDQDLIGDEIREEIENYEDRNY